MVDAEFAEPPDVEAGIGLRIRELRRLKSWSVQQLADHSGVSAGMISQLERSLANPSLRTLTKLCLALGIQFTELFAVGDAESGFVRRNDRRPFLDFGPGYFAKEILSPALAKHFQMMILHVPPKGRSGGSLSSYPSEKGGFVLSGEVVLVVGDGEVPLRAGDSFQFDGIERHSLRNDTDTEARVLWIIAQSSPDRHI